MKLLVTYLTPPGIWHDQVIDVSLPVRDHRDIDEIRKALPGFRDGATVIINLVKLPLEVTP